MDSYASQKDSRTRYANQRIGEAPFDEKWRGQSPRTNIGSDAMTTRVGAEDSEVVIGFVGPVGVASHQFVTAATTRLSGFGYHPTVIRLSACLDELRNEGLLSTILASEPEFERIRTHMDAGDELRGLDMPEARGLLAAAAVAKIASHRERYPDERKTKPLPRSAWLISSLKNPDEVEVFRRVYGPGFFLVGLFATEKERRQSLERGMSPKEAIQLIARDAESEDKHGQQTRKTFELADVWVRNENQLCRFLDLVFGDTFNTSVSAPSSTEKISQAGSFRSVAA